MKYFLLFVTFFFVSTSTGNAAIITVDNKTPSVGNYKTLQEAHDGAQDGDTIYVYPSSSIYSGATIEKKLIILGTGVSDPGPELKSTIMNGSLKFIEGSEGSKFQGFSGSLNVEISDKDIVFTDNTINSIVINEAQITFTRNKTNSMTVKDDNLLIGKNNISSISIQANKVVIQQNNIGSMTIDGDNTLVKQNNISNKVVVSPDHVGTVFMQNYIRYDNHSNFLVTINSNNELIFRNNIIWNNHNDRYSLKNGINASSTSISMTLENNILWSRSCYNNTNRPFRFDNSDIQMINNIVIYGYIYSTVKNFSYNISNLNTLPSENGNLNGVNMSNVFVNHGNGDFHLKENSPAIGAGKNGVDMGIYGGNTPFVDSSPDTSRPPVDINAGKPGIPSIIKLEAESGIMQDQGLKVEIKARANQ